VFEAKLQQVKNCFAEEEGGFPLGHFS